MADPSTYVDQAADNTKKSVSAGVDTVASSAKEGIDALKDRAASGLEQAKTTASGLAGNARDMAESGKNAGADALHSLAGMAKDAAQGLESRVPGVAGVVRNVASSVDRASHDLHEQSIEDIGASIAKFARRQPMAAAATAFVAGLLVARMFSSR